jgi:hypothetical protein
MIAGITLESVAMSTFRKLLFMRHPQRDIQIPLGISLDHLLVNLLFNIFYVNSSKSDLAYASSSRTHSQTGSPKGLPLTKVEVSFGFIALAKPSQ